MRKRNRNTLLNATPERVIKNGIARNFRTKSTVRKRQTTLHGGPMNGQSIWVWSLPTAIIEIQGERGRYAANSRWEALDAQA